MFPPQRDLRAGSLTGLDCDMNVFLDTCIVNRVLDLEASSPDPKWQEDREYLQRLVNGPAASATMTLFVNPSVISQIEATSEPERRNALLSAVQQFKFTEFNVSIFPFSFPVRFLSTAHKAEIQQLCMDHPALANDEKILADSAFNENMDVLLTTDRDIARKVPQLGRVKVMLPKQLWDYL
ncbi:hypothetical protein ES703_03221 [subsurface metagenome]